MFSIENKPIEHLKVEKFMEIFALGHCAQEANKQRFPFKSLNLLYLTEVAPNLLDTRGVTRQNKSSLARSFACGP